MIKLEDIRIDTFQVTNRCPIVRITHYPTGLVVEYENSPSKPKSRMQAWKILADHIKEIKNDN